MYIEENNITKKNTLGKSERVRSLKDIDRLFKEGNSFLIYPLRIYYHFIKGEGNYKAGFTASSRNFSKAVDRNRIKRLIRESYRLQKHEFLNRQLPEVDLLIFFLYVGKDIPDFILIKEKMGATLQTLSKIIDENAASAS